MDVMVSVLMTVYNHECYLAKAIEGVLRQKTNFKYEFIIGEDCSTDKSRDIVIAYQKKYPDIIRAMLNPVNLGMEKNGWQVTEAAEGKYIAICEGDDYWIDPNKLQTQVDFLESHPEYSGCYHSVNIVDEDGNPRDIGPTPYIFDEDSDYCKKDWHKCILPGQTGSIVMRNLYSKMRKTELDMYLAAACNGDNKVPILLLCYGKIRKMGRVMSCYRRSYTGDSWNARCRSRDMRAYFYINALERDRLAMYLWRMKYLPHNEARWYLQNVMGDVRAGKAEAKILLKEMVAYNPWKLVALQIANDMQRLSEWEQPLLIDIFSKIFLNKSFVIFGTGYYGKKCYGLLETLNLGKNVRAFWDNNEKKQGSIFHGVFVDKPKAGLEKDYLILISSTKYEAEMRKQLRSLGYLDGNMLSAKEIRKESIRNTYNIGRNVL